MKKALLVLFSLTVLIVFAFPGGQQANNRQDGRAGKTILTLRLTHPEGDPFMQIVKEAVAEFNETNNFNVEIAPVESMTGDQYKDKILLEMAAGGTGPDIFYWWATPAHIKSLVDSGSLLKLDEYLVADPEWRNSFKTGILDTVRNYQGGSVYSIPNGMAVNILYYNKEILDNNGLSVPKTYQELLEAVKVLSANGIVPFTQGAKDPWMADLPLTYIISRLEGFHVLEEANSGTRAFTDPTIEKAANLFKELVDAGMFGPRALSTGYVESENEFLNGLAAFKLMYNNQVAIFDADGSPIQGKWGVATFPVIEGGKGDPGTFNAFLDQVLVIKANTAHKDASVAFLKLLSSEKYATKLLENAGVLPTVDVPLNQAKLFPNMVETIRLIDSMTNSYIIDTLDAQIVGAWYNAPQAIIAGTDVKTALSRVENMAKSLRR